MLDSFSFVLILFLCFLFWLPVFSGGLIFCFRSSGGDSFLLVSFLFESSFFRFPEQNWETEMNDYLMHHTTKRNKLVKRVDIKYLLWIFGENFKKHKKEPLNLRGSLINKSNSVERQSTAASPNTHRRCTSGR